MSLHRNTLWNLAGSAVPLVAGVALIPYSLAQLGKEAFGVLTLVWGLIGYFSLFDLGVGRALTVRLSQLTASGQQVQMGATIRAGMLLTLGAGVVGALLVCLLTPSLVTRWLGIAPALQDDALWAFWIAAAGVVPTTLASGLRGVLEGLERFAASNISRMVFGLWMFAVPAGVIAVHGPHLWLITLYLVAARLLVVLWLALQVRAPMWGGTVRMARAHVQSLWSYGAWVTVTGIVGPLMVYGDRFFVSAAVGTGQLSFYAIVQEGLLRLLLVPTALAGALLPQLASMVGTADGSMRATYRRAYRQVGLGMLGVCVAAAVLAYPALALWLSADFAKTALPIALILCVGVWINSLAVVPYTLLHAHDNPRLTAIFHVLELVLYCAALWWFTQQWGLVGAAWAWVARVALDWVLLHLAARRLYGV
jgi:O-antigen/teichoic acid export membrane protein